MDIAGTATTSLYGSSTSQQTQSLKQVFKSAPVAETAAAEPAREGAKALGRAEGFALGALRQEIRGALINKFSVAFPSAVGGYEQAAPTPSDVAGDALAAAGQVVKSAPLDAGAALKQLRDDVAEAGDKVRDVLEEDDLDDVEDAMARIGKGLDKADDDAARNTVSSASFLSAESTLRQRSTIKIRTQEGDVVKLDLRRRESFSAEDVSLRGPEGSFTSTEVSVSSRSRLAFTVKGDINEKEFAAIKGVFERAESIAADFFGGDLAKAFDAASSLDYDSEQLARVSLRLRERETTRVNFAQIGVFQPAVEAGPEAPPAEEPRVVLRAPRAVAPSPPADAIDAAAATEAPADVRARTAGIGATPADPGKAAAAIEAVAVTEASVASSAQTTPVGSTPSDASEAAAETGAPAAAEPPEAGNPIDAFAEMLGSFLRSTLEGFGNGGDQRFFFGESFRLNILKTVVSVGAPEGAEQAAETAGKLIDAVTGEDRDD